MLKAASPLEGVNIDPMPIALRHWQQTRGALPAANGSHGSEDPKTAESVKEETEIGTGSNGSEPSWLVDIVGGTSR